MRLIFLVPTLAVAIVMSGPVTAGSVVESAHNLSATGPGTVRAASESRVCKFCHTPHQAAPATALWNRRNPGTTYAPYFSSTALASPGQPNGASLLCLSCHDGTVALGDVLDRSSSIPMSGGTVTMPPGRSRTGTDLRNHHPVSFAYDASLAGRKGELALPSSLPREVRLDRSGQMQCTSCHDPHDNDYGDFLVMRNDNSRLCVECHRKSGWSASTHNQSAATWNGQGRNPWPNSQERNVSSNACGNCHETHQTGGGQVLLRHAAEEENCAACHNGNVASKDVMDSFEQFSAHPVSANTLLHNGAEPGVIQDRHVECSDCHDPHQTRVSGSGRAVGPGTGPRPAPNARGVNLNNTEMRPASRGYEVCLRCHGDSPGKRTPKVRRQLDQNNVRAEIQQGNPSFHPIAGPGRNPDVPSLIAPLTPQSIMDCVDCHNSSSAASGGANGPHGSSIEPILAMNYETTDNTPESPSAYALCYSCHSRDSILGDESFSKHDKHIRDLNTPCSICHDAHGVSAVQGNMMNNTHLINFDTTVVRTNSQGILRFDDQGRYSGSCDLMCHGEDHQSETYSWTP